MEMVCTKGLARGPGRVGGPSGDENLAPHTLAGSVQGFLDHSVSLSCLCRSKLMTNDPDKSSKRDLALQCSQSGKSREVRPQVRAPYRSLLRPCVGGDISLDLQGGVLTIRGEKE